MTPPSTRLTSAQVAARLGVKPATLYAYVSRGLLTSARAENGGSTFDPLDVEAFAASRRRGTRSGGSSAGRPLMVVESDKADMDVEAFEEGEYRIKSLYACPQASIDTLPNWQACMHMMGNMHVFLHSCRSNRLRLWMLRGMP